MMNALGQPMQTQHPMMQSGPMMSAQPQMMPMAPPGVMQPPMVQGHGGMFDHRAARDAFSTQRGAYQDWRQGGMQGDPMQRPQWHDFKMQWQQQHPQMSGMPQMPLNPGIVPPGMQHPMSINPATAWHPPQAPANMVGPNYGIPNATPAASPFGLPVY